MFYGGGGVSRQVLGLDSRFFSIVLSKKSGRFRWVSGRFLERLGSLERMEMEGTPRGFYPSYVSRAFDAPQLELLLKGEAGAGGKHPC